VRLANPDIERGIFFALPSLHHLKALQLERMPYLGSKLKPGGLPALFVFQAGNAIFRKLLQGELL